MLLDDSAATSYQSVKFTVSTQDAARRLIRTTFGSSKLTCGYRKARVIVSKITPKRHNWIQCTVFSIFEFDKVSRDILKNFDDLLKESQAVEETFAEKGQIPKTLKINQKEKNLTRVVAVPAALI